MFGPGDLILHDALAHNSIVQGAILSGARRAAVSAQRLAERSTDLLAELRPAYRRVVIAIEGVYSMDGDYPRPAAVRRGRRSGTKRCCTSTRPTRSACWAPHGRGIGEHFGIPIRSDVDIWMGTLSKSLGSCGGYIAGSQTLIEYLKYTAPGFVFAGGISAGERRRPRWRRLRLLEAEPERLTRVHATCRACF